MTTTEKLNKAAQEAMALAQKWESEGVIVTIERVANKPLAMGNHFPSIHVWVKREAS